MTKRLTVSLLFVCIVSIFTFSSPTQAGKGPYPELLPHIAHDVREILIKHGMAVRHDRGNLWFKIAGTQGSYKISFFKADEIPQAAKMETIQYCFDLYEKRGRQERFRLVMYRGTIQERNRLLFGIKPFFDMTIREDN